MHDNQTWVNVLSLTTNRPGLFLCTLRFKLWVTKCPVDGSMLDLNTTGIDSFRPLPIKGGIQAQENQEVSHMFVGGTHVCVGYCLYGSMHLIFFKLRVFIKD